MTKRGLTVAEAWWVVVDVCQCDGDRGGPGEPSHLAHHVLGLDDQDVLVSGLTVHVG